MVPKEAEMIAGWLCPLKQVAKTFIFVSASCSEDFGLLSFALAFAPDMIFYIFRQQALNV